MREKLLAKFKKRHPYAKFKFVFLLPNFIFFRVCADEISWMYSK